MKLQHVVLALVLVAVVIVSMAGFRGDHFTKPPFEVFPDMNYQDKVKDQVPSSFFADGVASRTPIAGTVAEEMPAQNDYWATGKWDETHWGDGIPVHTASASSSALQVNAANMARGRERYTISCEVCHGATGAGNGITSKYGLNGAANYHADKYRQMSDGEIFNTITNGKGQMLGYGYNVSIDDRWRIIMYIRSLQHSQNATVEDASPAEQQELEQSKKPAAPAQPKSASTAAPKHDYIVPILPTNLITGINGNSGIDTTYTEGYAHPSKPGSSKIVTDVHSLCDWQDMQHKNPQSNGFSESDLQDQ